MTKSTILCRDGETITGRGFVEGAFLTHAHLLFNPFDFL